MKQAEAATRKARRDEQRPTDSGRHTGGSRKPIETGEIDFNSLPPEYDIEFWDDLT